jgi:hypothetical protein
MKRAMSSRRLSRRGLLVATSTIVGGVAIGRFQASAVEGETIASAEDFVSYINQLYDMAKTYGGRPPDQLVMEFLRHEDYNDLQWDLLVGDVDQGFVDYVKKSGLRMVRYFRDPSYGIPVKASHFGASSNGVLVKGKPSGTATNRGDVAGWGGDLMTFYAEWRRDSRRQPSGYDYCRDRLARIDKKSTFMLDDMIEDADAFNIAMKVRNGSTIADEVKSLFKGGGYRSRFENFSTGRFGSEARIKEIAKNILLPSKDVLVTIGRDGLINSIAGQSAARPESLSKESLDGFCQGFAKVLFGLAKRPSSPTPTAN